MLEFLHVGFAYSNQPVLRDASFQLSEGALTALLSPNAGGKSTLLRLAAGLLKPAQGKIVPQFSCAKARAPHRFFAAESPRAGYHGVGSGGARALPLAEPASYTHARRPGDC